MQKLQNEPNHRAVIKKVNGKEMEFYFYKEQTFWSDHLKGSINDGYSFELFDILENESYKFPDRKIPKGNSKLYKLGEKSCNMDTAVGILGYKFFGKSEGSSVPDLIDVISGVLDWSGLAKNTRRYIQFLETELTEEKQMDKFISYCNESMGLDIGFVNRRYLNEALTIAAYESITQQGTIENIQEKLLPPPNKPLASIGDKALKLMRAVPQYKNMANAHEIEINTQLKEKDIDLKRISILFGLLSFTHKTVDNQVKFDVGTLRSQDIQARLVEAIIGAIFLTLHDTLGEYGILLEFINKTVDQ